MATQQQFVDFLSEVEPSESTKAACSSAHQTLRERLASDVIYCDIHLSTYLSGSYARNTALRPRTSDGILRRPDVDIIVITNYTPDDLPSDVIATLRKALTRAGYEEIESNRRSVCVKLGSVEMDVVPIINDPHKEGSWLIADKGDEQWLSTNPNGHNAWAGAVNKAANGNFKPMVKLLKWWRRENLPNLKRPKGFILETIVAQLLDYRENSYEELFCKLLESIATEYQWQATMGQVPYLEDPSVPGNNVFSQVKPEEFKRFYDLAAEHALIARRAQKEQDPDKELVLWQRIFGDRFRKSVSKSGNLLQTAVASTAGLTFPAHAVLPPNKPSGFA